MSDKFVERYFANLKQEPADIKKDYNLLLTIKEDSQRFLKSEDYNKEENKHIKDTIEYIEHLD